MHMYELLHAECKIYTEFVYSIVTCVLWAQVQVSTRNLCCIQYLENLNLIANQSSVQTETKQSS